MFYTPITTSVSIRNILKNFKPCLNLMWCHFVCIDSICKMYDII